MVGCADENDVDIFPFEQIAVVFEDARRTTEGGARLLTHMAIDVA